MNNNLPIESILKKVRITYFHVTDLSEIYPMQIKVIS